MLVSVPLQFPMDNIPSCRCHVTLQSMASWISSHLTLLSPHRLRAAVEGMNKWLYHLALVEGFRPHEAIEAWGGTAVPPPPLSSHVSLSSAHACLLSFFPSFNCPPPSFHRAFLRTEPPRLPQYRFRKLDLRSPSSDAINADSSGSDSGTAPTNGPVYEYPGPSSAWMDKLR